MRMRHVGVEEMFGWILDSFRLVARDPGTTMGAGALTAVASMAAMIPMMIVMVVIVFGAAAAQSDGGNPLESPAMLWGMGIGYAVSMLLMLAVMPPMFVGWYRLFRAIDAGLPASATDVFRPYFERDAWRRSLGYSLLVAGVFLLVFAVFAVAMWVPLQGFFAAAMAGGQPADPGMTTLAVMGAGYFGLLAVMMFMQVACWAGFGEISLRSTPVMEAFHGGFAAMLRNMPQLLVFGIGFLLIAIVAGIVLMLVLMILGLVLSLIPIVGPLLLQVAVSAAIYPLVFASYYLIWRSLLGGGPEAAATEALAAA